MLNKYDFNRHRQGIPIKNIDRTKAGPFGELNQIRCCQPPDMIRLPEAYQSLTRTCVHHKHTQNH